MNQSLAISSVSENEKNQDLMDLKSRIGGERFGEKLSTPDKKFAEILDRSERMFLNYLIDAHSILTKDQIDVTKFMNVVDAIEELKRVGDHKYYSALVNPERCRGAKIPSPIPLPSSSFQLRQSFWVETNSLGNACIVINPFFLTSSSTDTTVFLNNSETLRGSTSDNNFKAINIGQGIPNVYNQYRLVSASVVAKYVGRLDVVQGLIGGCVVFDKNVTKAPVDSINAGLAKYGDFNIAQDAAFNYEKYSFEGIRELYFPLDGTWDQYHSLGESKDGYGMLIYIFNAPPSTSSFKIDVFFNMECLPDATFLNYIPTSVSNESMAYREESINAVKRMPISSPEAVSPSGGDFVSKLVNTIGAIIPSVNSILSLMGI